MTGGRRCTRVGPTDLDHQHPPVFYRCASPTDLMNRKLNAFKSAPLSGPKMPAPPRRLRGNWVGVIGGNWVGPRLLSGPDPKGWNRGDGMGEVPTPALMPGPCLEYVFCPELER